MLKVIVRGEGGNEVALNAEPGGKLWDAIQEQIREIIGEAPEGQPNGGTGKRRGRPPKNAQTLVPPTDEASLGGRTPSDGDADIRIV